MAPSTRHACSSWGSVPVRNSQFGTSFEAFLAVERKQGNPWAMNWGLAQIGDELDAAGLGLRGCCRLAGTPEAMTGQSESCRQGRGTVSATALPRRLASDTGRPYWSTRLEGRVRVSRRLRECRRRLEPGPGRRSGGGSLPGPSGRSPIKSYAERTQGRYRHGRCRQGWRPAVPASCGKRPAVTAGTRRRRSVVAPATSSRRGNRR